MATLKEVRDELRQKNMHIRKTGYGNEHQVYHHGDKPSSGAGYFTDDLEDARGTGHKMAESRDPIYKDQHKNKS